jgi:hypothetical protein
MAARGSSQNARSAIRSVPEPYAPDGRPANVKRRSHLRQAGTVSSPERARRRQRSSATGLAKRRSRPSPRSPLLTAAVRVSRSRGSNNCRAPCGNGFRTLSLVRILYRVAVCRTYGNSVWHGYTGTKNEPSSPSAVHPGNRRAEGQETAAQKVRMAEDAWNSRDPTRVALAYTPVARVRPAVFMTRAPL